jgi:protein TonB
MSSRPPERRAGVPPVPPPLVPAPRAEGIRNFLGWAFVISIGLHLIIGPFLGQFKQSGPEDKEVEKVSVTKKIKVVVPTPPPKPTPPPTPPPHSTPPPVKMTAPPQTKKLKLNVPHTHSNGPPQQAAYVAPPVGDENGNPNGNSNKGPAVPAQAPPGTPAPPTPTPKPACAQPHLDASAIHSVEPEYPEMAKEQGAVGVTQVEVSLTETGAVADAKVYKSSGNKLLDQAAIAAARQSTFSPEVDNCVKVAGDYLFRAQFDSQ